MSPGLVVLVVALVAATAFGLHRRRVDGRFDPRPAPAPEVEEAGHGRHETPAAPATTWTTLTPAVADASLGEQVTFVQFSSAFCAPCRTTRVLLADVAATHDGVSHVEVDAEQHLDLVRALDVRRTPTTLVLDAAGREIGRAAGAPRREQVLAAIPTPQESR